MKRIFAFVFCLVFLLSSLALVVSAEEIEKSKAEEIKEVLEERVAPIMIGVLTSVGALLTTLGTIKKTISSLKGTKDELAKENEQRKKELELQLSILEKQHKESLEALEPIYKVEREGKEVKDSLEILSCEIEILAKMVTALATGNEKLVRSGTGKEIYELLKESEALLAKIKEEKEEKSLCEVEK